MSGEVKVWWLCSDQDGGAVSLLTSSCCGCLSGVSILFFNWLETRR